MTDSSIPSNALRRGLSARHLTMITIGGAIGTGIFLASGGTISKAGPGGALVAFALIGALVFLVMQSLCEMATQIPVSGSFSEYAHRFVSPSFGFATGWNYWFNWAICLATELVAASVIMKYWFPDSPSWMWSLIFLVLLFGLNALSVRAYGEGEFWFALIKVVAIIVFLVLGVLMIAGIVGGPSPGLKNWTLEGAPFLQGLNGILFVFMIAGFSFQGTELVGVTAGEVRDPQKNVPKAIRTIFVRIMVFYIGAILVIAFLIPHTDPRLLNEDGSVIASPFTMIFEKAGILGAAALMNAIILTSILSAGNSSLYATARMLHALAAKGQAPKLFSKVTKSGVPFMALLVSTAFGCLAFLTSLVGDGVAYTWLVNATGVTGFIAWMCIAYSHIGFRRAMKAQGMPVSQLKYKAAWYPFGPIVALVVCGLVILGQAYEAIVTGKFDVKSFFAVYLGLFLFFGIWGIHKLVTKSPAADPALADLHPQETHEQMVAARP